MLDYLDKYTNQIKCSKILELRSQFHKKNQSSSWLTDYLVLKEKISHVKTDFLEVVGPRVKIGKKDECHPPHFEDIKSICKHLIPWRKGPYDIFGLSIDAEWDSSIKWSRLKPHLNVQGKKVCDIGSNNGYFMWKLLEEQPELVVGLEPVAKHWQCFETFKSFLNREVPLYMEPLGVEQLSLYPKFFDTILCLGIYYHRRDPLVMLKDIFDSLSKGGEVILDTSGIDDPKPVSYIASSKYYGAKGFWFLPSVSALSKLLKRVGFREVELIYEGFLGTDEQSSHPTWSPVDSLGEFLEDSLSAKENEPKPYRFYIKGKK